MRIEVDKDTLRIEIYNEEKLISRLNFDMCDDEMLECNAIELADLLTELKIKCDVTLIE